MRKKKQVNRFVSSMIFSLVAMSALSQTIGGRPTLIVGITIDQLRSDYIDLLQSHFGENGFKRLLRESAHFENLVFDMSRLDKATTTAVIYTGAYPNVNGISAYERYDDEQKRIFHVLNDPAFIGNATDETLSPMALKVSTISDELKMDNNGIGSVYAIAPDAQQAIIMAGHAADGAFWISDNTGKWASTTFYKSYPINITNRNLTHPIPERLDTLTWRPLLDINKYPDIPLHRTLYSFKYTFNGENGIKQYKNSALFIEVVYSVAIYFIKILSFGSLYEFFFFNIAYCDET